jgi:hypothetical protein
MADATGSVRNMRGGLEARGSDDRSSPQAVARGLFHTATGGAEHTE